MVRLGCSVELDVLDLGRLRTLEQFEDVFLRDVVVDDDLVPLVDDMLIAMQ